MTLENQTDGNGVSGGQGDTPNPPSSPATPKPFDGDAAQLLSSLLDQRFSAFEKSLTERVGRAQGAADRSQNAVRELAARIEQYEKKGMSREEAITAIETTDADTQWRQGLEKKLDDLLAGRIGGNGNATNGQQVNAAEVFGNILGQDVARSDIVAHHLTKTYGSRDEMELAAYRLREQLSKLPNPSAAQSASLQGGSTQASNLDALSAEYETLSANPAANFERMTQIQQEINQAVK